MGVFLFTRDDELAGEDESKKAAPRDNVIFETGYFISAKGKRNVLIIRESGAKMPADLGGVIYLSLSDRNNIDSVKPGIEQFINSYNTRRLLQD